MTEFKTNVSVYDNGKPGATTDAVVMNQGRRIYSAVPATIVDDEGDWSGYFTAGVYLAPGGSYVIEARNGKTALFVVREIRGSLVRFDGSGLSPFNG